MSIESWLSNTPVRNERLFHCGMGILMVLFIAIGFAFHHGVSQSVASIGKEREQCIELCASEPAVRQAFDELTRQAKTMQGDLDELLNTIPKRVVDSEILSLVRKVAQVHHCSLIDFRPGRTQKYNDFQTRSFGLHLEGEFRDIFQFFESLPQLPFTNQIGQFKILEPSVQGGVCRLDVELNVLFDHAWTRGTFK